MSIGPFHLGQHTHYIRFKSAKTFGFWPGHEAPDGLIVDLRLDGPDGEGFYPDQLLAAGVPPSIIERAAISTPPGYVLIPLDLIGKL